MCPQPISVLWLSLVILCKKVRFYKIQHWTKVAVLTCIFFKHTNFENNELKNWVWLEMHAQHLKPLFISHFQQTQTMIQIQGIVLMELMVRHAYASLHHFIFVDKMLWMLLASPWALFNFIGPRDRDSILPHWHPKPTEKDKVTKFRATKWEATCHLQNCVHLRKLTKIHHTTEF